ncbi:hypothetical protein L3X38_029636 [Prunus dulcis]|uniref:Uncharacterized protein n=1 Tax=Prunus dulcis TaxID=3755 RepID=A0AAD4VTC1_PRUDU|nr:hypothetical protein L3X38_029636 [Prunus dulcis]
MLATGDGKTWNIAYKNLINCLADIMEVADVVVEHKNEIFNLQNFLTLPLNLLATDLKIVPIFVQIVIWELKKVIIEEDSHEATSLMQEAKKTFGRKFKVADVVVDHKNDIFNLHNFLTLPLNPMATDVKIVPIFVQIVTWELKKVIIEEDSQEASSLMQEAKKTFRRKFKVLCEDAEAMEFALLFPAYPTFSSTFSGNGKYLLSFCNPLATRSGEFSSTFPRNSIFSGKCLQQNEFRVNATFSGKYRDRMHGKGFGIIKGGSSDIPEFEVPEFEVKEILEFVVPQPRLSYRNRRTPRNYIYTGQSEYQSTRDLRLGPEQLNELCKIHEKMLATGDGKTWNIAYKNLINRLADLMEVADVVVEHKNDIFDLQNFLTLPLNLLATDLKIVPIFVQIVTWELKKVIIEENSHEATSLMKEAKKTFGCKFKSSKDLRLGPEQLNELCKIHEKMLATGDGKTWNIAYKNLINRLADLMEVADVVVEHKNDIFDLQNFLTLPLNLLATDLKIVPIFVQIVTWELKKVIIEEDSHEATSLMQEAKKTFGRKFKVLYKDAEAMEFPLLFPTYPTFSSTFSGNGKYLLSFCNPLATRVNATFLGKCRDRMHGRGFGIVKGGTSDIPEFEVPEFEVKEILEFVVPQPRLSYRNRRTPRNCIYTGQSEYQSTRDLRLCSEQLNELCKIHEKMLSTEDGKTWNITYKNLINRLAGSRRCGGAQERHLQLAELPDSPTESSGN